MGGAVNPNIERARCYFAGNNVNECAPHNAGAKTKASERQTAIPRDTGSALSAYFYQNKRMNRILYLLYVLMCACLSHTATAQHTVQQQINTVIDTSRAKIGVGILGLSIADSIVINDEVHYPMQSVYKFPLAMTILYLVDAGKLSMDQVVHITRKELDTNTWSPIVDDYPNRDVDMTLRDLLIYTVSKSDNNGCDVLFKLVGGCDVVNDYIHNLGVNDIAIKTTEAQMHQSWKVQYANWCRPSAMLQLLRMLYEGKTLSPTSKAFLMKAMTASSNSDARIKGMLPPGTIVAHKTGTSNTNKKGIKAATNDVGIVMGPNGAYALVVFVSDYTGGVARGERMIAEISRIVYEHYTKK